MFKTCWKVLLTENSHISYQSLSAHLCSVEDAYFKSIEMLLQQAIAGLSFITSFLDSILMLQCYTNEIIQFNPLKV